MPQLKMIGWVFCLVGIGACQPPEKPALLQHSTETALLEVQSALSPEEQARLDKIANRSLLQGIVDNAPSEQATTSNFACSAQRGGIVTYLRQEERLRGLRLSLSEEQGGRSTRWYYQHETAVLVAHEQSHWQGNQERIEQTVFYRDKGTFLQVLHRVIQASPNRLEQALGKTPFELATSTAQANLWAQLQEEEQQLLQAEGAGVYAEYFCP